MEVAPPPLPVAFTRDSQASTLPRSRSRSAHRSFKRVDAESDKGRPRLRVCTRRYIGRRPCPCCVDDPLLATLYADVPPDAQADENNGGSAVGSDDWPPYHWVDTHAHLDEVLQIVARHSAAPTLTKPPQTFTPDELAAWRCLGWAKEANNKLKDTDEVELAPAGVSLNTTWEKVWVNLTSEQLEAAKALGYTEVAWNRNKWLLPKKTAWPDLEDTMRRHLEVLGETPHTWNSYRVKGGRGKRAPDGAPNDLRLWDALPKEQQDAATSLGLSKGTWNCTDMADLSSFMDKYCGPYCDAVIAQGCDQFSITRAAKLALEHPKVYVCFGVHPKSAWSYNDDMEEKFLAAFKACGKKSLAWGEFGLDFSHKIYGPKAVNRRHQKEVFARQMKLAIKLGLPMVIHSRAADSTTLKMLRQWVPRDWRIHLHSYRGTVAWMQQYLAEFSNGFIGLSGICTMADTAAHDLVRKCPLDRLLLETDAPYLPVMSHRFPHFTQPGHVPEIVERMAELRQCSAEEIFTAIRKNTHTVYGI